MGKKDINIVNEVLRKEIIDYAAKMFMLQGIKDVKMDDIAQGMGISKRTIYEQFSDKKELLFNCLESIQRDISQKALPYIQNPNHNTLEIILFLYCSYLEILNRVNKKFFTDLAKYPEIVEAKEKRERLNERKFMAWIKKGVEEGLFRKDVNFDIVQYILKRDIDLLSTTDNFPEYTSEELGRSFILFYLRGIATDKGQEIIEKFIRNSKH